MLRGYSGFWEIWDFRLPRVGFWNCRDFLDDRDVMFLNCRDWKSQSRPCWVKLRPKVLFDLIETKSIDRDQKYWLRPKVLIETKSIDRDQKYWSRPKVFIETKSIDRDKKYWSRPKVLIETKSRQTETSKLNIDTPMLMKNKFQIYNVSMVKPQTTIKRDRVKMLGQFKIFDV